MYRQTMQTASLFALTAGLTSLVVEVDLVVRVERLAVPLHGSRPTRDPDLSFLSFDEVHHSTRDDDPAEGGLLLLLVGVAVEQADLVLVNLPSVHPSDPVPLVLNDGEWIALRDQLEIDGDHGHFR